jgi:hypothetical protein
VLEDEIIDVVLIVLKSTDYRLSLAEIASMQAMNKFLENLKPQNIYLAFTHCDESKPDKKLIDGKI